ncbi:MAG: hypothetical protein ACRD0O_01835 [Acidimicrobiia bacterium]
MSRARGRQRLLVALVAVIATAALGVRSAGAENSIDTGMAPMFKVDPTPCGEGALLMLPVGSGVFLAQVLQRVDSIAGFCDVDHLIVHVGSEVGAS